MSFADFKSFVAVAEPIAKIIGFAVAGWWTFVLFIQKREKYPRARTTHSLMLLGKIGGYRLLRLAVKIENLGNVLIELREGRVSIQAIRPLSDEWKVAILHGEAIPRIEGREFAWPDLEKFPFEWGDDGYMIEPLESEEFHFDLTLADTIEAIQVYSYFKNVTAKGKELGWMCTTIQTIPGGDDYGEQTASPTRSDSGARTSQAAGRAGAA